MSGNASRDALTLHCSSCGAPFAAGATACAHCGGEITIDERRLDRLCDGCGARTSTDARYCTRCGRASDAQVVTPLPAGRRCPRCDGTLRARDLGRESGGCAVVECSRCAGLWLTRAVFDHLCQRAESAKTAWEHLRGPAPPRQPLAAERVRYLPCAECRQLMVRRNFGGDSGVILDLCGRHGLWFDLGEIEKVLEFVRGGGLARERSRELEQAARRARELRESSSPMRAGGSFGGILGSEAGGGLAGFLIDVLFSD